MTKRKTKATAKAADWLAPYRERFLRDLTDQGYATATLRTYDGAAALLCRELSRRGLGNGYLVGQMLSKVRAAALKGMHSNKYNQKIYCLERFIDALAEAAVAERPKPAKKAPTALERLRTERPIFASSEG